MTAAPALPGGRTADLRIGHNLLEVKAGWLLGEDELQRLIDQTDRLRPAKQLTDQPVRYVAVYLARYETMLRYPFDTLATRCANPNADILELATTYLALHRTTS